MAVAADCRTAKEGALAGILAVRLPGGARGPVASIGPAALVQRCHFPGHPALEAQWARFLEWEGVWRDIGACQAPARAVATSTLIPDKPHEDSDDADQPQPGCDRRAAAGETLATLERATVQTVDGKPLQRYMRALPTQGLCLSCHGPADQLASGVAERLKALYPEDRAVGYSLDQIRGAMTLRRAP